MNGSGFEDTQRSKKNPELFYAAKRTFNVEDYGFLALDDKVLILSGTSLGALWSLSNFDNSHFDRHVCPSNRKAKFASDVTYS